MCTDRCLNCALDHQSVMAAKALYTTLHTTITSLHNQILRCCRQASRNEMMAPGTGECADASKVRIVGGRKYEMKPLASRSSAYSNSDNSSVERS